MMIDTLKDNLINVVFSKCTDGEGSKSSELFLRMVTKILQFADKNIVEKNIDSEFTQKFGLSLRCDYQGTLF